MARGYPAGANNVIKADNGKSMEPSKKVVSGKGTKK